MTELYPQYIGLDVGKTSLDFYSPILGKKHFKNTDQGIRQLVLICQKMTRPKVVCEATSHYHLPVVRELQNANIGVSVNNPRRVRNFARAKGFLEKTDAIDSRVIAEFGEHLKPRLQQKIRQESLELKALQTQFRQLTDMIVMEKTHYEGLCSNRTQAQSKVILEMLVIQREEVMTEMDKLIEKDMDLIEIKNLLLTAPGVGNITANTLIAELPELGILSARAISKLIGLAPLNNDNGSMRVKRSIHGGRRTVRNALYMATLSAKKFNPSITAWLNRKNFIFPPLCPYRLKPFMAVSPTSGETKINGSAHV